MAQISASPSTKKISDLAGMIKWHELILQPEFQRKLVWNPKHKEAFIETILKGFPFPEIYIVFDVASSECRQQPYQLS